MAKLLRTPRTPTKHKAGSVSASAHPTRLAHHQALDSNYVPTASRLQQHYYMINGVRARLIESIPTPVDYDPTLAGHVVEYEPSEVGVVDKKTNMEYPSWYRHHVPYDLYGAHSLFQHTCFWEFQKATAAPLFCNRGFSSSRATNLRASLKAAAAKPSGIS